MQLTREYGLKQWRMPCYLAAAGTHTPLTIQLLAVVVLQSNQILEGSQILQFQGLGGMDEKYGRQSVQLFALLQP